MLTVKSVLNYLCETTCAYLPAKLNCPMFSRSEVMQRTNKQTDAAENIHLASLRYAGW